MFLLEKIWKSIFLKIIFSSPVILGKLTNDALIFCQVKRLGNPLNSGFLLAKRNCLKSIYSVKISFFENITLYIVPFSIYKLDLEW